MWLNALSSNNDPRIIGSYFVECVMSIEGKPELIHVGCPRLLRADNGTENSVLSFNQLYVTITPIVLLVPKASCMVVQLIIRCMHVYK